MGDERPLIGVTVGSRPERDGRPRLAINRPYVVALQAAGADVVLLPPTASGPPPLRLLRGLDGLLIPGGADVNPSRYGEAPRPQLGAVDDELDELELTLVCSAVERGLPILGICRGQQVVNVALGGDLCQDLVADGVTDRQHASAQDAGRAHLAHAIEVRPGTQLARVVDAVSTGPSPACPLPPAPSGPSGHLSQRVGEGTGPPPPASWEELARGGGLGAVSSGEWGRVEVNSFHHQAVRRPAAGLTVSSVSIPDRVIEGLESADGRVVCVQCHPEELAATHRWAHMLFSKFVQECAR